MTCTAMLIAGAQAEAKAFNEENERLRAENIRLAGHVKLNAIYAKDNDRLRAENERLRAELAEYTTLKEYAKSLGQRTYLELHAENERLRAENESLLVIHDWDVKVLNAVIERLREALRKFVTDGLMRAEANAILASIDPPKDEPVGTPVG